MTISLLRDASDILQFVGDIHTLYVANTAIQLHCCSGTVLGTVTRVGTEGLRITLQIAARVKQRKKQGSYNVCTNPLLLVSDTVSRSQIGPYQD